MITIKTKKINSNGEYKVISDIEGSPVEIKNEIIALLQQCKEEAVLRHIIITAIKEVLHDKIK